MLKSCHILAHTSNSTTLLAKQYGNVNLEVLCGFQR